MKPIQLYKDGNDEITLEFEFDEVTLDIELDSGCYCCNGISTYYNIPKDKLIEIRDFINSVLEEK